MKKILIVGGGANQIPLILASRLEGYFTVVVDYAGEKCPAYSFADRFFNISTQDEDGILEVARKEGIDGIISNSEPSMLIVNSIAEKLNLVGNQVEGIQSFLSKYKFRDLQRRVGVYAPNHFEVTTKDEAVAASKRLKYPVLIKPCETSSSRGCKKMERFDEHEITTAFQTCVSISRNRKVVVEEYVEMPSLQTIEGDIFVYGDSILWDGLFYTTRASWAPMVPMTYTAPMRMDDVLLDSVKLTIQRLVHAANIRYGEFNIEGFFTSKGEFFVIEINARQGGNYLPDFVHRFTGIDYDRLLVTTCVNDNHYWRKVMSSGRCRRNVILHSVYSSQEGIYQGLAVDPLIENKVTHVTELLSIGDKVEQCIDGTSIVASIVLEFDNMDDLYVSTPQIQDLVHVKLS
jgi:biotin carboxylase